MLLKLKRQWFTPESTVGELFIDGIFECFILEDQARIKDLDADGAIEVAEVQKQKVQDVTAIPPGTYRMMLVNSPRFGWVPRLENVPGYTDILIHAGNRATDTRGCLIVGLERRQDSVLRSRDALAALMAKIREDLTLGRVWITIEEHREEA